MLVAYASKTGNVARFVERLPVQRCRIWTGEERIDAPCVLVTYTTGFGQVPAEVERFVTHNRGHIRGVAASGNRNWGANFARSADVLAGRYGLPILLKFELAGSDKDAERFLQALQQMDRRAPHLA